MKNQFYMILPSNSSMKVYPENTTSCYVTKLPQEINLHGLWEVGISEIHFPRSFLHLRKEERDITMISSISPLHKDVYGDPTPHNVEVTASLPYGVYNTFDEFLEHLNTVLFDNNAHINFHYSTEHNNTYVFAESSCDNEVCNFDHSVRMSRAILDILGYAEVSEYVKVGINPAIASRPANILNALPRQLYIYTDICEPTIVGDVQAALLRIAPVNYKDYVFASNQYQTFTPVNYIPLIRNCFRTITIDIRDHLGRVIPFECGTSTVTLHFRQST